MSQSAMTKWLAMGLVALVLLGRLLWWGAEGPSHGGHRSAPEHFSVFYTCDTRGHIEPCGCASGMAGGISRRQGLLLRDTPRDYLLVDAGDVTAGPREWERLELEYILKGYAAMGYHAVNLGHRELSLGRETLRGIVSNYPRFVSANVVDLEGRLVCPPYVVVELSNGFRCGIMGMVDEAIDAGLIGEGLRLLEPVDAIAAQLPGLKQQADYVVLLAFTDEVGMRALAQRFFEIDLIVGGRVQQGGGGPLHENRSVIVFTTDQGKAVGRLDVVSQGESRVYENRFATLDDTIAKAPEMTALIEAYKQELRERQFLPVRDDREGLSSITAKRSAAADRYVGAESCRDCHAQAYDIWLASKHARAFETLVTKGHQYTPRCLMCHTVGYTASDGYLNQNLTPHLTDVSCEACHGRRAHHVLDTQSGERREGRMAPTLVQCESCHDQDNSPHFERERYWKEIAHGKL